MKTLPAHLPPLPEGYVYLGTGGSFKQLPDEATFTGLVICLEEDEDEWRKEPGLWGLGRTVLYAAPADSGIVRLNFPPADPLLAALKGLMSLLDTISSASARGYKIYPSKETIEAIETLRAAIANAEKP